MHYARTLWLGSICALALPGIGWAAAKPPASAPAGVATSRPVGAVTQALVELYRIPRKAQPPAGEATKPTARAPINNGPRAGVVQPQQRLEADRNGLQHADAIRNSDSSLPIGDDIRGAEPKARVPNPQAAPPISREQSMTARMVSPELDRGTALAGHRLSSKRRRWVDYRYFGGNPSSYGYGRYSRDYGLYDDYAGEYFRFGFLQGQDQARREMDADERTQHLLASSERHLGRGLELLKHGEYRQAVMAFKLAVEQDQGDPAARLYAAHSLFAIGRYAEAMTYLRKAFSLQPKIVMLVYDIRDDYGRPDDFAKQVQALEAAQAASPQDLDRTILLGYVYGYSDQLDRSYEMLSKANKLDPRDKLAGLLLENAQPPDVVVEQMQKNRR